MPKKIIILGTGGNCIDILDTLNTLNAAGSAPGYACAGFLDDNEQNWGRVLHGVPVLGPLRSAPQYAEHYFVNGIGSPRNFWKKRDIIAQTAMPDDRFAVIVHPTASVSAMAALGPGTVVFQNATITSNVRLGKHVIVLPNSVVSHDVVVGDYTCIAGGVSVSGGVTIGQACYLGTHAAINGNLRIGACCLIGMGSVVLKDVEANQVVVGNPARFLRPTLAEDEWARLATLDNPARQ